MLKMRLQRVGRTHEPSFRLVLTDSKNSTKSGRFKEILGSYDPRKTKDSFNAERIKYWLSQGVTPTATVNNLLITNKIISGEKIHVSKKSKNAPSTSNKEAAQAKNEESAILEEAPAETQAEAPAEKAE